MNADRVAAMPANAICFLDQRTLEQDVSVATHYIETGMSVLDIGCGTGFITKGIADAVGATGRAVGIDTKSDWMQQARERWSLPQLSFAEGDVYQLNFEQEFDVVVCARVLTWLDNPTAALRQMAKATKVGGKIIVLDYNHHKWSMVPSAPAELLELNQHYLNWRAAAGLHNDIGDTVAGMMADVGLSDIKLFQTPESTKRGDPDFDTKILHRVNALAVRGERMVADGRIDADTLEGVLGRSRGWCAQHARFQSLYMITTVGTKLG